MAAQLQQENIFEQFLSGAGLQPDAIQKLTRNGLNNLTILRPVKMCEMDELCRICGVDLISKLKLRAAIQALNPRRPNSLLEAMIDLIGVTTKTLEERVSSQKRNIECSFEGLRKMLDVREAELIGKAHELETASKSLQHQCTQIKAGLRDSDDVIEPTALSKGIGSGVLKEGNSTQRYPFSVLSKPIQPKKKKVASKKMAFKKKTKPTGTATRTKKLPELRPKFSLLQQLREESTKAKGRQGGQAQLRNGNRLQMVPPPPPTLMSMAHQSMDAAVRVDGRFAKYAKMKKIKVPMAAIENKMRMDGLSDADIALCKRFLSGPPLPPPPFMMEIRPPPPPNQHQDRFAKYEKMRKIRMPMAAIANMMRKDGLSEVDIATFTGDAQPSSPPTKDVKKLKLSRGGGGNSTLLESIRAGKKLSSAKRPRKVSAKAMAKVQEKPNLMDQLKNGNFKLTKPKEKKFQKPTLLDQIKGKQHGKCRLKAPKQRSGLCTVDIAAFKCVPDTDRDMAVTSKEKIGGGRFAKYEKLKRFKVPMIAIETEMRMDGLSAADIATFKGNPLDAVTLTEKLSEMRVHPIEWSKRTFTGDAQPRLVPTKVAKRSKASDGCGNSSLLDAIRTGKKLREWRLLTACGFVRENAHHYVARALVHCIYQFYGFYHGSLSSIRADDLRMQSQKLQKPKRDDEIFSRFGALLHRRRLFLLDDDDDDDEYWESSW